MSANTYIQEQIARVDQAIALGEKALSTANSIHGLFRQSDSEKTSKVSQSYAFSQDTFKYFDINDAQEQVARLQLQLTEFKKSMIAIKIENDQLLLNGGYLPVIDQKIAGVFLANTLCKLKARDATTTVVISQSVQILQELKEALTALSA
jgi:hypothetical protein